MLFVGIYLAANPKMYLDGLVRLFPMCQRAKLQNALRDSGEGLRKWLLGQLVSMVSVGLLTGLGLWMVGAPLPLALGLMAGLLEFIPVVGPILAIGPGVLVALTGHIAQKTLAHAEAAHQAGLVREYLLRSTPGNHDDTPLIEGWRRAAAFHGFTFDEDDLAARDAQDETDELDLFHRAGLVDRHDLDDGTTEYRSLPKDGAA